MVFQVQMASLSATSYWQQLKLVLTVRSPRQWPVLLQEPCQQVRCSSGNINLLHHASVFAVATITQGYHHHIGIRYHLILLQLLLLI